MCSVLFTQHLLDVSHGRETPSLLLFLRFLSIFFPVKSFLGWLFLYPLSRCKDSHVVWCTFLPQGVDLYRNMILTKMKLLPRVIVVFRNLWMKVESLPVSERLRLRELPHSVHSENLDHAVRVQSSLQASRHSLIWEGKGPAHLKHSVILADSALSPTQLTPVNMMWGKKVTPFIQTLHI